MGEGFPSGHCDSGPNVGSTKFFAQGGVIFYGMATPLVQALGVRTRALSKRAQRQGPIGVQVKVLAKTAPAQLSPFAAFVIWVIT